MGKGAEPEVAGHGFDPGIGDQHHWLLEVFIGQADTFEHRAGTSALDAAHKFTPLSHGTPPSNPSHNSTPPLPLPPLPQSYPPPLLRPAAPPPRHQPPKNPTPPPPPPPPPRPPPSPDQPWIALGVGRASAPLTSFGVRLRISATSATNMWSNGAGSTSRPMPIWLRSPSSLPGPASSQVGIGIGTMRAGFRGGFAAWLDLPCHPPSR